MEDASDAELVLAVTRRDPSAEATLCRRYAPRVRLYGLKHLRSEQAAQDLVQTVLVALLEAARAGRIDDPRHVDRFVLGTSRNCVSRMRQRDLRTPLASEEAVAALPAIAKPERIELTPLLACMSSLDERGRQVLMLSFVEEHSAEEIASQLTLSAGNVRVLRHRALASLRRCLDAKETA